MNKSELRHRIEQFASLQAAHRALARSVHPSELAPVREQSRRLLIQLQALSSSARDGEASPPEAGESITLEQVDSALNEQSQRTLEILTQTDLTQLRATVPLLAEQHPDEVGGLVDLLLSGDLEDDKSLRTLEYLITMLSAEEQGGRRVVVRKPDEVRPRLRQVAQLRLAAAGEECMVAERVLDDAAMQVLQQGEIGEIRDRVRRYKEDLGSDILHPKVLAAAVAYNVAMFNCVAAEIDSSRAIDELAEELFDPAAESAARASASAGSGVQILGSQSFQELVAAFRAKLVGEALEPGPASRVVEKLSLDALRAEDAEVFSDEDGDEATLLMRSAITLGLVLRHLAQTQGPLRELGLEPEQLATHCVADLMAQMTEHARKLFTDSDYSEAFRLSDVKSHSLAAHAVMRPVVADAGSGERSSGAGQEHPAASQQAGAMASLVRLVPPQILAAGILALLILGLLFGPPMVGQDGGGAEKLELARISPFLESGERGRGDGATRFGGRLSPAWDYLGTRERREVASEIGSHFAGLGVSRVSLLDAHGRVVAIYSGGELVSLSPRPGDEEAEEL